MDRSENGSGRTRGGSNGTDRGGKEMSAKERKQAQKVSEDQKAQMNRVKEAMKRKISVGDISPFIQDVTKNIQMLSERMEAFMLAATYSNPDYTEHFNEAYRRIAQMREKLQEIESSTKGLAWFREQVLLWNSDERNRHIVGPMFAEEWLANAFAPNNPSALTLEIDERIQFAKDLGMTEMFVDFIILGKGLNPEADPGDTNVIPFPTPEPVTSTNLGPQAPETEGANEPEPS